MPPIQTVIFDLDGTLLDTIDDLGNAVNHALRTHHLPERSRAEIRNFLGNGIRNLVLQSVPEGLPEDRFEQVFQSFRSHYVEHCMDLTRPYPGIMDLLGKLQARQIRMAIVSNKLQPAVTMLNERFFHEYIHIAVGESATVRRKPNPDAVLRALEELGSTPEQSLYVGDSEVDIETSRRAKVACVNVTWGFRDEDYLRSLHPDYLVHSPQEIAELPGIR